jgi:hypothetical protein
MSLARGSRLRIEPILNRAAAEAARFLDLRSRDIEIVRAKRQTRLIRAPANIF